MPAKIVLNLHHLKLFYYVAKFGGVTAAARKMPERVEPSTVSRQLAQLEKDLGLRLLERRPFQVTPAGEQIYGLLKPVYEGLPILIEQLRRGTHNVVRVGAAPIVMRQYIPVMVEALQQRFPDFQPELSEGLQWQIENWFKDDQLDLAVTMIEGEPPEGCLCEGLLRLPMVLLVSQDSPIRSAPEIWKSRPITHRLICPKMNDAITRCFRKGLQKLRVEWPNRVVANSIEMAESHVRRGLGIAVSLAIPGHDFAAGLRALPLPGFPLVTVGIIWRPQPNPATLALMELLREEARRMLAAAGRTGA
jgi:DNA-binding transcriptional LysR family regulator